jgi:hypothetical protein
VVVVYRRGKAAAGVESARARSIRLGHRTDQGGPAEGCTGRKNHPAEDKPSPVRDGSSCLWAYRF